MFSKSSWRQLELSAGFIFKSSSRTNDNRTAGCAGAGHGFRTASGARPARGSGRRPKDDGIPPTFAYDLIIERSEFQVGASPPRSRHGSSPSPTEMLLSGFPGKVLVTCGRGSPTLALRLHHTRHLQGSAQLRTQYTCSRASTTCRTDPIFTPTRPT